MNKVTKSDLLRWVSTISKRSVTTFDQLTDGSIFLRVFAKLFPKIVSHVYKTSQAAKSDQEIRANWDAISAFLNSLGVSDKVYDRAGCANGRFRSLYNFIVLLFFFDQLARSPDFSVDFDFPVSSSLASFLQSNSSVEVMVKGGLLDPALGASSPRTPRTPLASTLPTPSTLQSVASQIEINEENPLLTENSQLKSEISRLTQIIEVLKQKNKSLPDRKEHENIKIENRNLIIEIDQLKQVKDNLERSNQSLLKDLELISITKQNEGGIVLEEVTDLSGSFKNLHEILPTLPLSRDNVLAIPSLVDNLNEIQSNYLKLSRNNQSLQNRVDRLSKSNSDLRASIISDQSTKVNEVELIKSKLSREYEVLKTNISRDKVLLQTKLDLLNTELNNMHQELLEVIKHRDNSVELSFRSQQDLLIKLRKRNRNFSNRLASYSLRESIWSNLLKSQQLLIENLSNLIPKNSPNFDSPKFESLKDEITLMYERLTALQLASETSNNNMEDLESEAKNETNALTQKITDLLSEIERLQIDKLNQVSMISDLQLQIKRLSQEIEESKFENIGYLETENQRLLNEVCQLKSTLSTIKLAENDEISTLKELVNIKDAEIITLNTLIDDNKASLIVLSKQFSSEIKSSSSSIELLPPELNTTAPQENSSLFEDSGPVVDENFDENFEENVDTPDQPRAEPSTPLPVSPDEIEPEIIESETPAFEVLRGPDDEKKVVESVEFSDDEVVEAETFNPLRSLKSSVGSE
ncbi:hypothetical protein RCL1_001827 [Eukaryota sp. TZLM3-RCL]